MHIKVALSTLFFAPLGELWVTGWDEAEASGDLDGEDDEGDNFEAIPDYGSSFGVQQVSAMLHTPAHQRAGRNKNIVIVGS